MNPRHPASPGAQPADSAHHGCVTLPIAGATNAKTAFGSLTRAQLAKASAPAAEACNLLRQAMDQAAFRGETVHCVGVTGPGEPLASPEATLAALEALHAAEPGLDLFMRSNGLGLAAQAERLAAAGVGRVILDVDAVAPDILQRLFIWIRPGSRTLPRGQAAQALLEEQTAAIKALKEQGLAVTIRTKVYPGLNDAHLETLARRMAELGADDLQLVAWEPQAVRDAEDPAMEAALDMPEAPPAASAALMDGLRQVVARFLPLTPEPDLAGSPALGLQLGDIDQGRGLAALPKPSPERPNVAVATSSGFEVDMHLGQARQFLIYGAPEGVASLIEVRNAPASGQGDARWQALAQMLADCSYILAAHAGQNPEKVLGEEGIRLVRTEGDIEAVVDALYGGGKKQKCRK